MIDEVVGSLSGFGGEGISVPAHLRRMLRKHIRAHGAMKMQSGELGR